MKDVFTPVAQELRADVLPGDIATPCLVVSESAILANLEATARACGGAQRLMPHVKTHRAAWVTALLARHGVQAFKAATVMEVDMVLEAGGAKVVWAYPTVNGAHIAALLNAAQRHPAASVGALVDSAAGLQAWRAILGGAVPANVRLYVDLDPGMGRTGAPLDASALDLAREVAALGMFGGWHVYDGHIQDKDIAIRRDRIATVAAAVRALVEAGRAEGLATELIAGASYSFDAWPSDLATYVAPGSWVYSSSQHDTELGHLGWTPGAYVAATVISRHGDTVTLDAGAKAISPDKPLADRFRWEGRITMMSEEHCVVENAGLAVGDKVLLMPRHACTTAYLYERALVRTLDGRWEYRPQLGNRR
jgi:D-serine deaminase-like pyridoxal phosphate-dependent protein